MGNNNNRLVEYWKKNIRYVLSLLAVWFFVGYVLSIFFVNQLDKIKIAGFKLGFWFAQQGSILVFIALIFIYVSLMNKLDREYDVHED